MDKLIYLTKGKVTVVDEDDYEELSKYKWYYHKGYAVRMLPPDEDKKRKMLFMHIQIIGKVDGLQTDHINRDGLDNRKDNLRHATASQNQWNQGPRKGTSKYKGVSWSKIENQWCSQIQANKKIIIGYFDSETDAAKAYDEKSKELFGDFAYLNGE